MRRKGFLLGAWALVTLSATLVAWAAVRQVTDEVSPAQALPFPSAVALADATVTAEPAAAPRRPASGERQEEPRRREPVAEQDDAPAPDAPAGEAPVAEAPAAEAPAAEAPAVTEAYNLTGGVVTVRYQGGETTLVSASPNSGFAVDVNDGGPGKVDVRFRSDQHESRLVTRWRDGAPDPAREERPR